MNISKLILSALTALISMTSAQETDMVIHAWGGQPKNNLSMANKNQKFYNILSVDGGGIRGIIPIQVIKYLEDETYKYALEQGYIDPKPEGVEQKLLMPQFFDHFAGTSIGGIIALCLAVPNEDDPTDVANPRYSSTKAMELLGTKGGEVFQTETMVLGHRIYLCFIITLFGGIFSFIVGRKCFKNSTIEQRAVDLEKYMEERGLELGANSKVFEDSQDQEKATPVLEILTPVQNSNVTANQVQPANVKEDSNGPDSQVELQPLRNQDGAKSDVTDKPTADIEAKTKPDVQKDLATSKKKKSHLGDASVQEQFGAAMLQKIKKIDKKAYEECCKNTDVAHLEAKVRLFRTKRKYLGRKKFSNLCAILFTIAFFIAGYFLPSAIYFGYRSSTYGRANLDFHLLELFGDLYITDALREVTVIAYEFITNEPRIYSKFSTKTNPELYTVSMYDAAGATSAAPYYFDPKIRETSVGVKEYLIDGGIIFNNPSVQAEMIAELSGNTLPVRVISLGTGASTKKDVDVENWSMLDWWARVNYFTTGPSQRNAAILSSLTADQFVRTQTISVVSLDGKDEVDALVAEGETMVAENKEILDELVKILVEENRANL